MSTKARISRSTPALQTVRPMTQLNIHNIIHTYTYVSLKQWFNLCNTSIQLYNINSFTYKRILTGTKYVKPIDYYWQHITYIFSKQSPTQLIIRFDLQSFMTSCYEICRTIFIEFVYPNKYRYGCTAFAHIGWIRHKRFWPVVARSRLVDNYKHMVYDLFTHMQT